MSKTMKEWIATDLREMQGKSISWLSQYHFFRDPSRPDYVDSSYFFSPADGIVVYQSVVEPTESLVDIKGRPYSLREALRDDSYDRTSLVIGIFMTFYDVHINRIPYSGRLSYREFEPLDTENRPMLEIEKAILEQLKISTDEAEYLHQNQRMVNRVDVPELHQPYYILQIADYDVDSITPFELKQNQPVQQGQRFSQIRYGSQVDLIIPLSDTHTFAPLWQVGDHVEGGIDPLVRICAKTESTEENPS
ncbi:phosphatidylserine decarboxylase [Nocardia terpenica]|uniref:Phosphatidylserine decarboxylase n=1 Tax=Nocardia terpenica TaxID=455432 RepID=A0A291RQ43_9NOCA|nr:phosphatidylserine decarboxylase [Nocardia terpenica]ATL69741.1 phosphatidylserine decarboxylase [Nocardia terpenica]